MKANTNTIMEKPAKYLFFVILNLLWKYIITLNILQAKYCDNAQCYIDFNSIMSFTCKGKPFSLLIRLVLQ